MHTRTASDLTRVAIYVRVSTAKQEDGASLKTQEDACRTFAAERGFLVNQEHVYREIYTGSELWDRPQLTKLREAVRAREVHVVVAYALDRLARDQRHLTVIMAEAEYAGVQVEFVTERLEDSPEGRLVQSVKGYVAEIERLKIMERTVRGRRARINGGRPLAGPRPPYGYRWLPDLVVPGRSRPIPKPGFEIDPVRGPIARRIWREYASGKGQQKIADDLSAEKIPTPSGLARWNQGSIRCILMNSIYSGAAVGWRWQATIVKDRSGRKQSRVLRPKEEQVQLPEDVAPALIDEATYAAVQARFRLNSEHARRHNSAPEESLLRGGFARCGYCGSTMTVHRRPQYASYRCSKHLRIKDACPGASIAVKRLDETTWSRLEAILTEPQIVAAELRRTREADTSEADIKRLDRQLTQVDRSIANLVERLAEVGPAVAKVVSEKLTALERQRDQLSSERESALSRRKAWEIGEQRLTELEAWCQNVARRLGQLNYEERRMALQALNVRVRVWRSDHTPYFDIEIGVPLDDGDPTDGVIEIPTSGSTDHRYTVTLSWTLGVAA